MMVEQCGGTLEQRWWNIVVEQWNSDGGTVLVEQCGGTVMVEKCGGTVWWKSGTVLWNSGTVMVEQCWWKSERVIGELCGGTLEE